MKNRLSSLTKGLFTIIQKNPVELLVGFTFFILAILADKGYYYDKVDWEITHMFPLLFFIPYILNRRVKSYPYRSLYILSYGIFIPLLFIDMGRFAYSTGYWYSLLITALLFVSYKFLKDNVEFSREAVRNVTNFSSGLLIGIIFYLITIGIYASFTYIFNLYNSSYFYIYAFFFTIFVIIPLCLMFFDQFAVEMSGMYNVLLNFIISPALIIYTAILYIYFAKILIIRELPKGNVAYMVFGFILFVAIGKVCQHLLSKRYYDWFYNRFSFISLPLLCMFWVGVGYRLNEYGITENRLYLIAAGIVITLFALLFIFPKTSHYVYVSTTAIILFSLLTFIPGISARDLDKKYRVEKERIYDSYYDYEEYEYIPNMYITYQQGHALSIDLSGYKTYHNVSNNNFNVDGKLYRVELDNETGILSVVQGKNTLSDINLDDKIKEVAEKHKIRLDKEAKEKNFALYKDEFMVIKMKEILICLRRCILSYDKDSQTYKVDEITVDFVVTK